jgi:hypothetical protein
MSSKIARIFLCVLAFAHLILAVKFATDTPYRQSGIVLTQKGLDGKPQFVQDIGAPDERQHANYVRHLLQSKSLPVFNPKSSSLYEEYQYHQPPLYYAVAGTVATVTGKSNPEQTDSGMMLRYLNCLIGTLGVVGTFFAGLRASRKYEIAVCAAAFHALLPMNIALSGAISNDPMLIALCAWGSSFLLRIARSDEDDPLQLKWFWAAALIAGLCMITKSNGVVFAAVTAFTLISAYRRHVGNKELKITPLKWLLIPFVILVILPLPIWLRNMSLYGDPLAQKAFREAFGRSAQKTLILQIIEAVGAPGSREIQYWVNWVGYWTARSFIGVYGYMDIWMNESGLANSSAPNMVYKLVILLNFLGLLGFGWLLKARGKEVKNVVIVPILSILLTCLVFIGFNNIYFQAQARYLFPALTGISLVLVNGWTQLFRKWQVVLAIIVVVYGGLSVSSALSIKAEFEKRIENRLPN